MPARMSRRSSFTIPLADTVFRVLSSPHLIFILHRSTRLLLMNGLIHCLDYGEYSTKSLYRCPPRRKVTDVLDNRPLAEQNYTNVEEFLQQQIGENLTLDYK